MGQRGGGWRGRRRGSRGRRRRRRSSRGRRRLGGRGRRRRGCWRRKRWRRGRGRWGGRDCRDQGSRSIGGAAGNRHGGRSDQQQDYGPSPPFSKRHEGHVMYHTLRLECCHRGPSLVTVRSPWVESRDRPTSNSPAPLPGIIPSARCHSEPREESKALGGRTVHCPEARLRARSLDSSSLRSSGMTGWGVGQPLPLMPAPVIRLFSW